MAFSVKRRYLKHRSELKGGAFINTTGKKEFRQMGMCMDRKRIYGISFRFH